MKPSKTEPPVEPGAKKGFISAPGAHELEFTTEEKAHFQRISNDNHEWELFTQALERQNKAQADEIRTLRAQLEAKEREWREDSEMRTALAMAEDAAARGEAARLAAGGMEAEIQKREQMAKDWADDEQKALAELDDVRAELRALTAQLQEERERANEERRKFIIERGLNTIWIAGIERICDERDAALAECEKWRGAASVLCAAHVGTPQAFCPACEFESLAKHNESLFARTVEAEGQARDVKSDCDAMDRDKARYDWLKENTAYLWTKAKGNDKGIALSFISDAVIDELSKLTI